MKVLFVCTGNSCRSVMAEFVCRKLLASLGRTDVDVSSAGTFAVEGAGPTREAIEVMKEEEGVDVGEHRSRPVTAELLEGVDRVYVMTDAQRAWVVNVVQQRADRVKMLRTEGVSDPLGSSKEQYRECLRQIKDGLLKLIDEL